MLTKEVEQELISKAFEMKLKAYCPYSNYQVGAAILSSTGKIYGGFNIENSSYGACNCGERTAIFKAVSEGEKKFTAIAVCGGKKGEEPKGLETDSAFPCGICRQVMREFVNPKEFKVYICISKDKYSVYTLEELLPHSFGPEFLLG